MEGDREGYSFFVRTFFSRPETDDTINNFKRDYMESMKKLNMVLNTSRNGSPMRGTTGPKKVKEVDELNIRSPPRIPNERVQSNRKLDDNDNVRLQFKTREPNSRISSTSTLGPSDEQIHVLIDEMKELRETLYRQQTQLQALKVDLKQERQKTSFLQYKVDRLESGSRTVPQNGFPPRDRPVSSSYLPSSAGHSAPAMFANDDLEINHRANSDSYYDMKLRERLRNSFLNEKYKNPLYDNRPRNVFASPTYINNDHFPNERQPSSRENLRYTSSYRLPSPPPVSYSRAVEEESTSNLLSMS
ncbi:uncharacterized protein KNAG_0J01400 [Huiozyma naganishii CBS 8797]|uniref:Spindle pole component 29 n=1 Tax=Huiozyma naganishii (strain ATCC MYA-139 / BCRC 22969 / CBS 8797 / KCTC 17520 / NBRC 10181 / NCYC 3082 / Yp74L-3) TaxID=1071383 RepID=J7SAJ3_HUIN7|nr:hypothetical protein KNAG_0J01400 [Kazachstania naganishii CBS 8797]CCK72221.1 hypothetical protein KNAG_0J01400 [Kazachstania naganishii CBS 8797]